MPATAARPHLALVVSRPLEAEPIGASPELAAAVALSAAEALEAEHGQRGTFPSVEDVFDYIVDRRGFTERESVELMVYSALRLLGLRRAAAIAAHRRPKPPRRRPSRRPRPVQLWLPFPEFARAAA